ncbi:MAG: cytochrome c5 family protein, partial [Nitrospirota bacterium]
MDGKAVYDKVCFVCHKTGISGSPKLGDKDAWVSRIDQGKAVLYEHSIKGFKGRSGFMPARGGRPDLSDDEIKAAVDYIVDHSK